LVQSIHPHIVDSGLGVTHGLIESVKNSGPRSWRHSRSRSLCQGRCIGQRRRLLNRTKISSLFIRERVTNKRRDETWNIDCLYGECVCGFARGPKNGTSQPIEGSRGMIEMNRCLGHWIQSEGLNPRCGCRENVKMHPSSIFQISPNSRFLGAKSSSELRANPTSGNVQ